GVRPAGDPGRGEPLAEGRDVALHLVEIDTKRGRVELPFRDADRGAVLRLGAHLLARVPSRFFGNPHRQRTRARHLEEASSRQTVAHAAHSPTFPSLCGLLIARLSAPGHTCAGASGNRVRDKRLAGSISGLPSKT